MNVQLSKHLSRFVLMISAFASYLCFAEPLHDKYQAASLVRTIMEQASQGKTIEGLKLLENNMLLAKTDFDKLLLSLEQQLPTLENKYGKLLGAVFLSEKSVADTYYVFSYLLKYESRAVRWQFYFYHPKDEWLLSSISTDENTNLFFED